MIQRWKLERELARIKGQFIQIPWLIYGKIEKSLYDRSKYKKIAIHDGAIQLTDRVAVLLIYQPSGVLRSTIAQLRYLAAHGFSTLVVSNTPLRDGDLEQMKEFAFQIMVRPNYGYDFGGYRDGVLHVLNFGAQLKALIVLNDSVWLPVHKDSDPVAEAMKETPDLFGITYSTHGRTPHRSHIQSYFFRFGEKVLKDPFFEEYWRNLPVSSNKYTVVRRCEMGLTNAFRSRGYSFGVMQNDKKNLSHLLSLSDDQMRDLLHYLPNVISSYRTHFEPVTRLLESGEDWRAELSRLINANQTNLPFLSQHPSTMLGCSQSPVLKKYKKEPYKIQREEIRRLNYLKCINPEIAEEIENWDLA